MVEFWDWARGDGRSVFRDMDPLPGAIESLRLLAIGPPHRDHHGALRLGHRRHPGVARGARGSSPARSTSWPTRPPSACDVYLDDAPHQLEALTRAHRTPPCAARWPPTTAPCRAPRMSTRGTSSGEVVASVAAAVGARAPDRRPMPTITANGIDISYTVEGQRTTPRAAPRRQLVGPRGLGAATTPVPPVVHAVPAGCPGACRARAGTPRAGWSRDLLVDDLLAYVERSGPGHVPSGRLLDGCDDRPELRHPLSGAPAERHRGGHRRGARAHARAWRAG